MDLDFDKLIKWETRSIVFGVIAFLCFCIGGCEHINKGKAQKTLRSTYFGRSVWEKHVKSATRNRNIAIIALIPFSIAYVYSRYRLKKETDDW